MEARFTLEQGLIKRAREEIQRKTGKTPEELWQEREERVVEAIQLKEPDRVPVAMRLDNFPIKYAGALPSVAFYEPAVHRQAVIKTILDFEPDIYQQPTDTSNAGFVLQALDARTERWPGGNLPPHVPHQVIGMACMKEDEYDLFITDPTDFIQRYYLPRAFGELSPLSRLPQVMAMDKSADFAGRTAVFATPEFRKVARTLLEAGQEQEKFNQAWRGFEEDRTSLGFPPLVYPGGMASAPFDMIADYLRGMSGVMIDMFRRPEKLILACERILEWRRARAVPADPAQKGYPRRVRGGIFHLSSDRFLSRKQFETFCWPTWKKALLATIDLGFTPWTQCQGKNDDRLEYFLELPKGKFLLRFTEVDLARAKSVLGSHCCLAGNVPSALLQIGSPLEVGEYTRDLIRLYGKGGGFMVSCGDGGLDDAKPANVKALIDAVKKYGRY
ncbi:MAG: hypothetical protein HY673_07920 [Chloroflexi bacterium]|nr:hypothetical protein [Chloroflexota bacterium]